MFRSLASALILWSLVFGLKLGRIFSTIVCVVSQAHALFALPCWENADVFARTPCIPHHSTAGLPEPAFFWDGQGPHLT